VLGDGDMGIDFISGPKMRTSHEDRDLAGGIRQVRLRGKGLGEVPIGLPMRASWSHGFQGPIKVPSFRMAMNP
jgi:hypothetical protein